MTRTLPRINFHSSALIRCLSDLAVLDAADSETAFAEKLGLWIHFVDAGTLFAVHNDRIESAPNILREAPLDAYAVVQAKYDRTRASLANSILQSCSHNSNNTPIKLPRLTLESPLDVTTTYALYFQFYKAHQRNMEVSIQPLRIHVRREVAKTSPKLTKLADLDAIFEKVLRDRESKLLAKIPGLLKKRFEQLLKDHQQKLDHTQQLDNPASWIQEKGWLARFSNDMQTLLLAELDLRMQPTLGLIEALKQNT